jgi:hypothetical protein
MEATRIFGTLYQIMMLLESSGVGDTELKFYCSLQKEIFYSLVKNKEDENKLVHFVNS